MTTIETTRNAPKLFVYVRTCRDCHQQKPESDYAPSILKWSRPRCRDCEYVYRKAWRDSDRARFRAETRAWKKAHPEAVRAQQRRYRLRFHYKMELEDYQRMYDHQGGRCAICDEWREQLHIDHDHVTGRVRMLLCSPCNRGLGEFRDDPARLLAAVEYLAAA